MKWFAIVIGLLMLSYELSAAEQRPPNVVFILADDLGINDLSCYGRKDQATPRLDRLASEGMRFTSAYCAQPICSPSRAAILSGLTPARLHLTTFLPGRGDAPSQKLLHRRASTDDHIVEHGHVPGPLLRCCLIAVLDQQWPPPTALLRRNRPRRGSGTPGHARGSPRRLDRRGRGSERPPSSTRRGTPRTPTRTLWRRPRRTCCELPRHRSTCRWQSVPVAGRDSGRHRSHRTPTRLGPDDTV